MAFVLSVLTIAIAVASVHVSAWWFSPGVMILPILAGGLLLWPRALRIYFGFAAAVSWRAEVPPASPMIRTRFGCCPAQFACAYSGARVK